MKPTHRIWDRTTQSWRSAVLDSQGRPTFIVARATAPQYSDKPLRARLALTTCIRDRADGPGIDAESFRAALARAGDALELDVLFDCTGGNVAEAMEIAAALQDDRRLVRGLVLNDCASAAMMILASCDVRYAHPDAVLMLHDPVGGDPATLETWRDGIIDVMRTGWPHISRSQFDRWMRAETWFDADDARRAGLINGLLDPNVWEFIGSRQSLKGRNRPWSMPSNPPADQPKPMPQRQPIDVQKIPTVLCRGGLVASSLADLKPAVVAGPYDVMREAFKREAVVRLKTYQTSALISACGARVGEARS